MYTFSNWIISSVKPIVMNFQSDVLCDFCEIWKNTFSLFLQNTSGQLRLVSCNKCLTLDVTDTILPMKGNKYSLRAEILHKSEREGWDTSQVA